MYFGKHSDVALFYLYLMIYFIIAMLVIGCGSLIVLGAYSRFANMLIALVYAGWKPKTAPLAESRGERGET